MSWKVETTRYAFNGDAVPTSQNTVVVGAAPPTITVAGGLMTMALTNANQEQVLCWNLGAIPILIGNLLRARFWVQLDLLLSGANTTVHFGVGSARVDNTIAGIVNHCAFGILGNIAGTNTGVIVRSQDGTNTLAATATGVNLAVADGIRKFTMNFSENLVGAEPPTAQAGGLANIILGADNDSGEHRRINMGAARPRMDAYALGVQPFVQLQKAASAEVGTFSVHAIELDYRVRA